MLGFWAGFLVLVFRNVEFRGKRIVIRISGMLVYLVRGLVFV